MLFFACPNAIKEELNSITEKEINHIEILVVIKMGIPEYSSPVFPVKRKHQNLCRACTAFHVLNDKLVIIKHVFPLVQDCILHSSHRLKPLLGYGCS